MEDLTHEKVLNILPDRDPFAHKGKFGKILLLCGSEGYTGAAALASMGACAAVRDWCSWAFPEAFMPSRR